MSGVGVVSVRDGSEVSFSFLQYGRLANFMRLKAVGYLTMDLMWIVEFPSLIYSD